MTNRNSNLDRVIYDPSIVELDTMPVDNPPMDNVMPSFDGMEDPKVLEDYRQIELADGGVVEREGFSEGDQPFDGRKEYNKQYYLDNKERIRELEKQSRGKKKNVQISDELPSRLRGNKIDQYGGLTSTQIDRARYDNLIFEINKRNQLGVFTIASDLEKISGIDSTLITKLIGKGTLPELATKEKLIIKYVKEGLQNNDPISELTKPAIAKYIGYGRPKSSSATVSNRIVADTIRKNFPDLFKQVYRNGAVLSKIKKYPNALNININDFMKDPQQLSRKNSSERNTKGATKGRLTVLKGKLKLGAKDFAVSKAQDNFITNINNAIRKDTSLVLDNPKLMEFAYTKFNNNRKSKDYGKLMPGVRDKETIKADIKKGFFSNEHMSPKALEKMNTEFPTNKILVPKQTNISLIKSAQAYLRDNPNDSNARKQLEEITNKFNFNINTENGRIGPKQGATVEGNKLLSYKNQLDTLDFNSPDVRFDTVTNISEEELKRKKIAMKSRVENLTGIISEPQQKILNQSLKSGFDPTEFARLFPEQAKVLKNIMLKVGTAARALEIPLELAVEGVLMGNAIAGGDTPLEAWRDTLVGYLDPTAYKDGMYRGPKISGADLKDLDLDLSQSARMDTELEKSNEKLQSLKDELEYAESMLNLEGLDELTTSEDYDSLRERIRDEQSRNDFLQERTSEASREELSNKRINQQDARAAGSAYTNIDKYASELEETTGFSELDYDLRKGIKDVRTVKERNFDTVEDQANFFVNNIPEIKEMYEATKKKYGVGLSPANFYTALREQNPAFNKLTIKTMMSPEYADEGIKGTQDSFSKGAVDAQPKIINELNDTFATGGRVGYNIDDIMNNYATGGRVRLDKGSKPKNPSRRTFLKGAGALGLAIAAFGTGALKLAKTLKTKTALKVLAEPAVGQPEWFAPLVDKILLKGSIKKIDDFAKNVATSTPNKPIATYGLKPISENTAEQLGKVTRDLNTYELEEAGKKFTLTKKPDGSISIDVEGGGAYDNSFTLSHKRYNVQDIETGKIKEIREFQASEMRPEYVNMGGDEHGIDYALEATKDEVFIGKDVFKLEKNGTGFLSDLEGVEKIATGKIKNPKLAETRTKVRNKLNDDPYKDRNIDDYDYQLDQDIGHDYID